IGIYLTPATILQNPGYLETLRDQLGLNLLVLIYTGELPQSVLDASPFDGVPPSPDRVRALISRHLDGNPSTAKFDNAMKSVGPHVAAGGDDDELRQAIDAAKRAGLEIWFMGGAWTASDYDVLMYCPSKEENNRWYEAVYTYLATGYGVDGVDITHARYPMTSYPRGLLLCTCDDCARAAAELGYDMAAIQADLHHAIDRLQRLDMRRFVEFGCRDMGPFDYLQILGMRRGVIDWFKFRAELLARNLKRFRDAVHRAAGDDFIFGNDTYPASFSMLAGHNHSRWSEFSDFASPLLSHVDIFPMRTLTVSAQYLRSLHAGLSEADALGLVYRFFGYDGLKMPSTIADFALGEPDCEFRNIPLRELMRLDLAKARFYLPPDIPSYPIIQGGGAPHPWPKPIIEQIIADILELGHDGYIFQGASSLVDFQLKAPSK
ncbi:MAG TPA: hypothetical protein VNK95_24550, partial [Caldilineaceae bacterium]|nr:hypothetical protein [Caldilineaceae bacterium]